MLNKRSIIQVFLAAACICLIFIAHVGLADTVVPRHVIVPAPAGKVIRWPATVKPGEDSPLEQKVINFSEFKYHLLVVLGSWNPEVSLLIPFFNSQATRLSATNVALWGIFTQDTVQAVQDWAQKNRPQFPLLLSDVVFSDSMKTPKVPSVYLIDKNGYLIQSITSPTQKDILLITEKVLRWTEF